MDYKDKYKDLQDFYGLSALPSKYDNADWFEKCIILLRLNNYTYSLIQSSLGNPSKKLIRSVLLEWAPELIDNSVKKQSQFTSAYSELYNLLSKTDRKEWIVFGDNVECYIKDKEIIFDGDLLTDWSKTDQSQILNEIKQQWNC